ncbi:MAG TPA: nitrile hydratase accessory protein [Dehalococcoidia bacterium]|nr:nitrile hydratase accessory protein [Dehalococcoidia bacterium]
MYERQRNIVRRADGRPVNVARPRGQLFVCKDGCCCGRVEDGFASVPAGLYHEEWERRRLRNIVHLTVGGCLGPCALANVALLLFDGHALWFHSLNHGALVYRLYDYIETLLDADGFVPPPPPLDSLQFSASAWQERPDGQPVDDARPRHACAAPIPRFITSPPILREGGIDRGAIGAEGAAGVVDRLIADMAGEAAAPRKNGELIFEAPWQGRAFGMAVALHEEQLYAWEEFRQRLIGEIARADAGGDPSGYYERWLAAFEALLIERGVVSEEELTERTYQFDFGERDDVF